VNGVGIGSNGLAFWRGDLYVANTDQGLVACTAVEPDGSAGAITLYAQNADLTNADGLAFDVNGNLYVVSSVGADKLVRVAPDGATEVLARAADGLDYSASLAARLDRKSVYIANVGVDYGHPGVVKATIGVPDFAWLRLSRRRSGRRRRLGRGRVRPPLRPAVRLGQSCPRPGCTCVATRRSWTPAAALAA
jgi:hypothetical protein